MLLNHSLYRNYFRHAAATRATERPCRLCIFSSSLSPYFPKKETEVGDRPSTLYYSPEIDQRDDDDSTGFLHLRTDGR